MNLSVQKRLAASILSCSPKRVWFDPSRLDEIKEVITKQDLRSLISDGTIRKIQAKGVSRVRANARMVQRRKGRQAGGGSRKGTANTHRDTKLDWMERVRVQRAFVAQMRGHQSISHDAAKDVLRKVKGGFFRSRRHIKLYLEEHKLFTEKAVADNTARAKTVTTAQNAASAAHQENIQKRKAARQDARTS
jgi:large subunit ribosomal protein L19e